MIRRLIDIAEFWQVCESTQERVAREKEREKGGEERERYCSTPTHFKRKASTHSTLTRTRKPYAAARPSAAEKEVRGSPPTKIQHNTPTPRSENECDLKLRMKV